MVSKDDPASFWILVTFFGGECISLDIQSHLLRFGIRTPKTFLKHQTSGGMTACLGYTVLWRNVALDDLEDLAEKSP